MELSNPSEITLELIDGTQFYGYSFGAKQPAAGEVVFNTGMVGYPESLTDPSYRGQILVLTYPLIGNYGVPDVDIEKISHYFESPKIQIAGLVVSDICLGYSHWKANKSLSDWLMENNIPGIYNIDTREVTKKLREKGTMSGRIISKSDTGIDFFHPANSNIVKDASCSKIEYYGDGSKSVILIDCGLKSSIIRSLVDRGVRVTRIPWDYDFNKIEYDGLFITNGPGDPENCSTTVKNIKKAMKRSKPIFGICLGNQLLALAAGAKTYKLKYGHRSQNQPCIELGTKRCYITSQNHGYAVDKESIPENWEPWFLNANDGTIEGIRHRIKPFSSVQFHPEAKPGPVETGYLFDRFVSML